MRRVSESPSESNDSFQTRHRRFWCEFGGELLKPTNCLTLSTDDCAALLLACLHCRFHEFMVLLPDTCERAVSRCFPSYRYVRWSAESEQSEKDCCSYKLDMDCNCCGSCRETGEFMELAMEISEVCYRWGAPREKNKQTGVFRGFHLALWSLCIIPEQRWQKGSHSLLKMLKYSGKNESTDLTHYRK